MESLEKRIKRLESRNTVCAELEVPGNYPWTYTIQAQTDSQAVRISYVTKTNDYFAFIIRINSDEYQITQSCGSLWAKLQKGSNTVSFVPIGDYRYQDFLFERINIKDRI